MASTMLTGCATGSATCVDWVHFGSDAAMAKDADVVLSGSVTGEAGETELFGERAAAYRYSSRRPPRGPCPQAMHSRSR